MKTIMNKFAPRMLALIVGLSLLSGLMTTGAVAQAYDPQTGYQDKLEKVRFWQEQRPPVRFYINAASRWILENVSQLGFGTNAGEWTAMALLRGMYTGLGYLEEIPEDYFTDYIQVVEQTMIEKNGKLHSIKYTEYSRMIMALLPLGYDIRQVAPHYRQGSATGTVVDGETEGAIAVSYDLPLLFSSNNSVLSRQGINGPTWVLISMNAGGYTFYTRRQLQAGLDGEDPAIAAKLAAFGITSLEEENKTVNSNSGAISNTGVTTEGKLLEWILSRQCKQDDGTVGGWALSGNPDPDVTGMVLQALAPYYLDAARFERAAKNAYDDPQIAFAYTYGDLKQAVERAIDVMSRQQLPNGGFASWGTLNAESNAQILVALTMLGIDPLSEEIVLPTIHATCSFVKQGAVQDGVYTNNLVDSLLSFWAWDSGASPSSGGFRHVTSGDDGGGGAGTAVNDMATDQALYALIAYDRFYHQQNELYNMSDMIHGEYQNMLATQYDIRYDMGDGKFSTESHSPYSEVILPKGDAPDGMVFRAWSVQSDGIDMSYAADEVLIMPEANISFTAVYEPELQAIARLEQMIDGIGQVTLEKEEAVLAAQQAFDALNSVQKELVSNADVLRQAQTELARLKLLDAKDSAIAELKNYKSADDYRTAQQAELAEAIEAGRAAIDRAADVDAVAAAVAAAQAEMDQIPTDAWLSEQEAAAALIEAKANAKAELEGYKAAADYRSSQQDERIRILNSGTMAIENAQDIATVTAALASAKAALDALPTDAQLTVQETAAMLESAKADAKAELNALFRASGQDGQEELSAAVAAGEQAIDRAGNLDEVAAALQAAKDGIESIRAKGEPPASRKPHLLCSDADQQGDGKS